MCEIDDPTHIDGVTSVSHRPQRLLAGAMDSPVSARQTGSWTDEKHLHFLNNMEASFVRAMFQNNDGLARLDRYLPDSSESTLDLKAPRREKHANPVRGRARGAGRADRRARRHSSQPSNPSQDQVVPQFESKAGSDKDERDPPVAPVD